MIDPLQSPNEGNAPLEAIASESPKQRSSPYLAGLVALGALGLLLAIGVPIVRIQFASREAAEASGANALSVETLTVEPVSSYAVSRTYTGEIAALRSSDLGFQRSGELIEVIVEEGDRVSAGQALARLDAQGLAAQRRQFEAQKAEAEARLLELERGARQEDVAAAETEVRDLEKQLELQEAQRSRREFLYREGAIAQEQLDEFALGAEALEARLDRAKSSRDELLNGTRPEQVAAQRAVVQRLEASIAEVDVDISKSSLKAPFDGIISARQVDEGAVVGAGQSVVRLVENAAPEARIGMPVAAASRLQEGNTVSVALGTARYGATVASLLPEVDPDTRTQVVVFQLEPAALPRINPGQTVRVEVTETMAAEGAWLPIEALTQDVRGLWSAYVIVPDQVGLDQAAPDQAAPDQAAPDAMENDAYQVQPKSVEILHQESDRVLVRGTLQPGDRVVASGVHRLVPGQRVQPL